MEELPSINSKPQIISRLSIFKVTREQVLQGLKDLRIDKFEHLKVNSLTCSAQHGFKVGHSTVTNILEALNVWTEALMYMYPIDVIYLDYANVFDTVPHQRLLCQIYILGIQGIAIDFIRAFVTGR